MALDWFVGYWRNLVSDLAQGHPVVFDRHYLIDLAIDPQRYRYGGPIWLVRLAQRLTPRPDLVLFLDVSEEVSQARKQEPGAENFSEQRQAYLNIAKISSNWCVIDASQPLPDVLAAVEKEILAKLPGSHS
jgi:thymidylate kinase